MEKRTDTSVESAKKRLDYMIGSDAEKWDEYIKKSNKHGYHEIVALILIARGLETPQPLGQLIRKLKSEDDKYSH
jgi:hypothetical protein